MKNTWITMTALILATVLAPMTQAKVRVVSSTTDLASIAESIGGDNVKVETIVRGQADPHFVEVLPSYMVKIARADIYLKVGMDLDYWANQLIDGSQNADLVVVDCSKNIQAVNVPTTRVNASMGDIHVKGNPHYWLDPRNGLVIAESIAEALVHVDPGNREVYEAGLGAFRTRLEAKLGEWGAIAERIKGEEIITYHDSWPYASQSFGVKIAGFIEPKPGIEPTPSHTARLIEMVKSRGIKVIGREPYFSDRAPKTIARETGATVVVLPTSVGGVKGADDYFALFDTLLKTLHSSLVR